MFLADSASVSAFAHPLRVAACEGTSVCDGGAETARPRRVRAVRAGMDAGCAGGAISERRRFVGMVVGLSGGAEEPAGHPASGTRSHAEMRCGEGGRAAHAATLICYAPSGVGPGHPDGAGAAGPCGHEDDHDPHARPRTGGIGCAQPLNALGAAEDDSAS